MSQSDLPLNSAPGTAQGEQGDLYPPSVYIIVLNWNGWRDTLRCLGSLRGLQYSNYQVIVVDNDSNDDSLVRIRESEEGLRILRNASNLGFAGGCNPGIRAALAEDTKYVWLVNNDAVVEPASLHSLIDLMERRPTLGAAGSVIYDLDHPQQMLAWGGGRINWLFGFARHFHEPVDDSRLDYLTGAALLLRVDAIREVGLLDEGYFMYWEDADLCVRLRKAGWGLAVSPDSRVLHAESSSVGQRSSLQTRLFNESAVRFFSAHSALPRFTLGVAIGLRLAKRLIRFDLIGCRDVVVGAWRGIAASRAKVGQ